MERTFGTAKIATEDDRVAIFLVGAEFEKGGPEDVPGLVELEGELGAIEHLPERQRLEEGEGGLGVTAIEEGERGLVFAETFPVGVLGILLLELGSIAEEDFSQFARGPRGVDGAVVAFAHEPREEPRVVDVGVGEEDGRYPLRIVTRAFPVELAKLLEALEHPAIDEDRPGSRLHFET